MQSQKASTSSAQMSAAGGPAGAGVGAAVAFDIVVEAWSRCETTLGYMSLLRCEQSGFAVQLTVSFCGSRLSGKTTSSDLEVKTKRRRTKRVTSVVTVVWSTVLLLFVFR